MCLGDDPEVKAPPPPAPPPTQTAELKIAPKKKTAPVRSSKAKGKKKYREDLSISSAGSTGSGLSSISPS